MAENTNCWLFLHKPLADQWEAWWFWLTHDIESPEPSIDGWDKARIRSMADQNFAFSAFSPAQTWDGREWRLLNTYDISRGNINAGIQLHGDAFSGGDFNALGYWEWKSRDDAQSEKIKQIDYRPDIAILFMPPVCIELDSEGNCIASEDATEVTDVNLVAGQPPRDLSET